MLRNGLVIGLAGLGLVAPPIAGAQDAPPSPEAMVSAMYDAFKPPKGFRPSHAKGLCAEGTFTATPEAAGLSAAPHFRGRPVRTTVRLSVAGASPKASDKARSARGMALRFHLPDDKITDMVMISAPVFGLRDPANFVALVESRRPDPATGRPDPAKVQAFNDAHPDTKAQAEYFKTAPCRPATPTRHSGVSTRSSSSARVAGASRRAG